MTEEDLEERLVNLAGMIHNEAKELGILKKGEQTRLNIGDPENGCSYGLVMVEESNPHREHCHPAFRSSFNHCGSTAKECEQILVTIFTTLQSVNWTFSQQKHDES